MALKTQGGSKTASQVRNSIVEARRGGFGFTGSMNGCTLLVTLTPTCKRATEATKGESARPSIKGSFAPAFRQYHSFSSSTTACINPTTKHLQYSIMDPFHTATGKDHGVDWPCASPQEPSGGPNAENCYDPHWLNSLDQFDRDNLNIKPRLRNRRRKKKCKTHSSGHIKAVVREWSICVSDRPGLKWSHPGEHRPSSGI